MTADDTTPQTSAMEAAVTVIEAAHRSMFDEMRAAGVKHESGVHRVFDRYARALHVAGLLADPADRDELAKVREERDYHHARADVMLAKLSSSIALRGGKPGDFWKEWHKSHCGAVEAAERAKEVAELAEKDRRTYHQDAIRAEAEVAVLRATVEKVRAIHERDTHYNECVVCDVVWPCPTIRALDGGAS